MYVCALQSGFRQCKRSKLGLRSSVTAAAAPPSDKVCLVTGASRGIGKAIAIDLASHGCKVVVNYASSAEAAEAVVQGTGGEMRVLYFQTGTAIVCSALLSFVLFLLSLPCSACQDAGGDAIAIKANVAKMEEVDSMFKEAVSKFGGVDVLVNNAGITRDNLMLRMKPDQWQDVIDLNLSGVFFCLQVERERERP